MNKVRYGIVGIGKMGGTHAKKLKQGLAQTGELAAVCDLSEERLAWAEPGSYTHLEVYKRQHTRFIVEAAAYAHDVGLQPAQAKAMLEELYFPQDVLDRVAFLVGSHQTLSLIHI